MNRNSGTRVHESVPCARRAKFPMLHAGASTPVHARVPGARVEPSAGNGAEFATYSWSQTLGDVSLTVPLPKGVKGRDCDVSITKDKLRVRQRCHPALATQRWLCLTSTYCCCAACPVLSSTLVPLLLLSIIPAADLLDQH